MRPQSRLAGSQNCGAIFQHLKLDMTLAALQAMIPSSATTTAEHRLYGMAELGGALQKAF
jgi:hypothetical protein